MPADGPLPEISVAPARRRLRAQRVLCLTLLPLLAIPLLLARAAAPPAGGDTPVALRSVQGQPSVTPVAVPITGSGRSAMHQLRQGVPTPSSTSADPPPTTVAPTVPTVVARTPAPPAATPPATAPPATAPPATAAPATTQVKPEPEPVTTTTPAPVSPSQSGEATWYRWKAGNCAHNSLPAGTVVTVTATASGRTATCVVGDRGAFGYPTIIDLDTTVFEQIAPLGAGRIQVTISW